MNKIKSVFFDLDGTLLNDSLCLSENTINYLKKFIDKNIICSIVSSRPLENILSIIKDIKFAYIACLNGSLIYNNLTNITETCNYLNKETSIILLEIIKNHDLTANIFCKNNIYFTRFCSNKINKIYQKSLMGKNIDYYNGEDILSIEIIDENNVFSEYKNNFIKIGNDVNVINGGDDYFEIFNKNVDKGMAVSYILNKMNINKKTAVAIGDSDLDKTMFKMTGYNILMKNSKIINEKGMIISEFDNNNDGAVLAVDKLLS